jgi:hypothetical protein
MRTENNVLKKKKSESFMALAPFNKKHHRFAGKTGRRYLPPRFTRRAR